MNHQHTHDSLRPTQQPNSDVRWGATAGLSSSAGKYGVPLLACPAVRSCFRLSLIPLLCWSLALFLLVSTATVHAQVRYVYDESGRLVQVIGPDGKSTRYSYDAAGNITSMKQDLSGALVISEFTPDRGPIGTSVTISGIGFSTTVSANLVKFNGVTATVSTATATTLVTKVPTGATTGSISVTVGTKVATSAMPFTITTVPDNGVPVITSFTPKIGFPGAPVSITGNNFSTTPTNNFVFFNSTQATVGATTPTTINTSVPTAATSGPIKVRTTAGTATSTTDFFVVPSGYTVGNISVAQRITVNGPALAINTGTVGKIAMVLFNGTQGQQYLNLGVSPITVTGGSATLFIKTPSGVDLMPQQSFSTAFGLDLPRLPETGFYTMLIIPDAMATVTATLILSTTITGVLTTNGVATTFASTRVGQNGRYTFAGSLGQHLGLGITDLVTVPPDQYVSIIVYKPDGTELVNCGIFSTGGGSCDLSVLPVTGTYTVTVANYGLSTSTLKLWLSTDLTGTLALNGVATTFASTRVGQNGRYTFAGSLGQHLGLGITDLVTVPPDQYVTIIVNKPDGTELVNCGTPSTGGSSCDLPVLPATGTYTVTVNNNGTSTSTLKLWLSSDLTGVLATNGAATTFTSTRVGQNGRYTFAGAAGQYLGLGITDLVTVPPDQYVTIIVNKPDGTELVNCGNFSAGGGSCDLPVLLVSGPYTVTVVNPGTWTSTLKFWLSSDLTGTLTLNGVATTFASTRVGQNGRYTFAGTLGQHLGLGITDLVTVPPDQYVTIIVNKPDGTELVNCGTPSTGGSSCDLPVLPVTGTYTVTVVNPGTWTSTLKFWLSSDLTGTLTLNGTAIPFTTSRVGQNARYSFAGSIGQDLRLVLSGDTFPGYTYVNVYASNGDLLASTSPYYDGVTPGSALLDLTNLPATGTYIVFITPQGIATGSINTRLITQ